MKKIKDGGPAFPRNGHPDKNDLPIDGMSLRDYFAIHASDADIDNVIDAYANYDSGIQQDVITRPEARYIYADAMLAAREAEK